VCFISYVPDISQALAGKRIHHRWAERLWDAGDQLRRSQAT
jgi:hypothetical protein